MPKRSNPVKNREDRMTRADSLASMGEFGKIVKPADQDSVRAANKKKPKLGPFARIRNVLSGGKY